MAAFRGSRMRRRRWGSSASPPRSRLRRGQGCVTPACGGPSVPQGPSRLEAVMGARARLGRGGLPHPQCVDAPPARRRAHSRRAAGPGVVPRRRVQQRIRRLGLVRRPPAGRGGGVVVVTANYRLGPLGYLYLPELGIENLGVQDQAAVLGWVGRNVATFGGNPGAVTVGGQSAGAYSALYLALSPVTGPTSARSSARAGPGGCRRRTPPRRPATPGVCWRSSAWRRRRPGC